MPKEYIEREALLQEVESRMGWSMSYNAIYEAIQEAPTADVIEVFRGKDSVLAEFENDYKDFDKIKTHFAQIIVEGKIEEPCYSILWWDEKNKEYNVGYSSYCLDYVRKWLELVFEVVADAPAADVVEVVRCKDCKWCTEKDELTKSGHCDCVHRDVFVESHDGFEAVSFDDFCSYGERRDNNETD